jgi:hypothetical protein
MILAIKNKQFQWEQQNNKDTKYFLSIRDAYHLLPPNQLQFDCQPTISARSLPCTVIICGCKNQLFIYHARLSESALINTIRMNEDTSITCIDMFRGD